ncbi:MAG: L-ribulose-5-phosphate 4-epimerase [Clostridia bacterium]|nr:L-ribulose-5-phosphate 4-epimerase [Clostridia bacterium]
MLDELKKRVFEENLALKENQLVLLTWGNVSAYNKETNLVVIKPSGVAYDKMTADDMSVVDLDGNLVEGRYRPSSDTPTHVFLYKKYPGIGGIVHTHSTFATAFAQAGLPIVPMGTTHADAFFGEVPCSRDLSADEINGDYESNTGKVIVETVRDPEEVPAVLVKNHGVFTWGKTPEKAVETAITVEEVAKMAYLTLTLNPGANTVSSTLLEKHYYRKHGKNAYYGQK